MCITNRYNASRMIGEWGALVNLVFSLMSYICSANIDCQFFKGLEMSMLFSQRSLEPLADHLPWRRMLTVGEL